MTGATIGYAEWAEAEDAILADRYPRAPWADLLAALPGRSKRAIMKRAFALGIAREQRDPTPAARAKWRARGKSGIRTGTGNPHIVIGGVEGKVCTRCSTWREIGTFAKHASCAGGRRNECTPCGSARSKKWNRAHPERAVASARRWQKSHPGHFKAIKAASEKTRRGKMLAGSVTAAELRSRMAEFHGLCGYCLAPATTWDHVTPLARGGRHEIDNMVPACRRCNMKKNAKTPLEFLIAQHQGKARKDK